MRTLSCGILVLNPQAELLLCHATGTFHWDIPKGGADPGESPLQAALRETREECGIDFAPAELLDLGRHRYRSVKDLHLYAVLSERFDIARCVCVSHFRDVWGRLRPEMDAFAWIPFERVPRRCARQMALLLTQKLPLPEVLLRLQAQHGGPPGVVQGD